MNLINRLLRKNLSRAQVAGFIISNFIGMAIVIAGVQFYQDVRSIWESEDSFIRKDYLVINKKVTSRNTLGEDASFSEAEIADLEKQPWVRKVGRFSRIDYRVSAAVSTANHNMSTYMFFESIPSEFIDTGKGNWSYTEGSREVPIIISKDYLTLYNFGFAASAGMPQMTEQMLSSVPLSLTLTSDDSSRSATMQGRVVGFSNRLNTILVPEEFMLWSNKAFGTPTAQLPSRLIIDVSSPGDVAITEYLDAHGLEVAGDQKKSQASYFLNAVTGVALGVGCVITVLSFFILMLSISLLMQKNRAKLHLLINLGFELKAVARPYCTLIVAVSILSLVLAFAAMLIFRSFYIGAIAGMGGGTGIMWAAPAIGVLLAAATAILNILAVRRTVTSAFYN